MALQVINVGSAPNDGLGDPIRTAYIKCNDNFGELYSRAQTVPPTTLVGSPGDTAAVRGPQQAPRLVGGAEVFSPDTPKGGRRTGDRAA